MLEYIILGFLLCSNMSGYDIKRHMGHSIAYFYDASFGSIYPMLKKMQRDGTVTMTETAEGGKPRKEYAITEAGREAFFKWLDQPFKLNRAKHDHLVRFFFYRFLPKERAIELIHEFIGTVRGEIAVLSALRGKVQPYAGTFEMATLDFGTEYYQFVADWCEKFIKQLNGSETGKDEES